MKKTKSAALYDPYLDSLGGGESTWLAILHVLENEGYDVNVFWDEDLGAQVKSRFNLSYRNLKFIPNIFKNGSAIDKLKTLKDFDIFLYITDGSYFLSSAKKNFISAMIPDKSLYNMSLLNKLKLINYQFISNSIYTKKWLTRWGIKSEILYPFVNDEFINIDLSKIKKEKMILNVGRFFKHLHSKRQDIAVKLFKNLKKTDGRLKDYKLVLAGALMDEDYDYYQSVEKLADGDKSIIFKPNISFKELFDFYKKSEMYWHTTGYEVDEEKTPYAVEHFGITPLEAMAAGCITFGYRAGGQKETINDGENGFLFSTEDELYEKIKQGVFDQENKEKILYRGQKHVKANFSYNIFSQRVKELFL